MHRLILLACLLCAACGSSSPTAPTITPTPIPAPVPQPTVVSLTGTVVAQGPATKIAGAVVTIKDGPNVGRSGVTNASGVYTIDNLIVSNANAGVVASGYLETAGGVFINGTNTLNFALQLPPFAKSGSGNTVFDVPSTVSRMRIVGTYTGNSSNFIVKVGGRLIVNELLGTAWKTTVSDGTYLTGGGVVEITNSTNVAWMFNEVR